MYLRQFCSTPALLSLAIPGLALLLSASTLPSQSNTSQTTQPPSVYATTDPKFAQFVYDVVSIKPLHEDLSQRESWRGLRETPDGLLGHCPAVFLIDAAFRFGQAGVIKPTGWVLDDNYDVEAKMEPEVAAALHKLDTTDQKLAREVMLQVILRDRFNFAFHTERHEVTGFDLVITKNGPKLKQSMGDGGPGSGGMRVQSSNGVSEWNGRGAKIEVMIGQLSYEAGRTVSDKTGLTGSYDFTLKFLSERVTAIADLPALDAAPALNTALQEQLGLKLVPSKTIRDFVAIDHIDCPSSN